MSSSELYFTPLNENPINSLDVDIERLTIPRKTLTIKKEDIQSGGCGSFPQTVIIDIPLKFPNEDSYVITDKNDKTIFKFHDNSKAFINDNIYFGCGTFTAIYSIKLEKQEENNKTIPDKYKEELILRIYENPSTYKPKSDLNIGDLDLNGDLQSEFIKNWIKHKKLFPENIIDIYAYGDIELQTLYGIRYIGFYSITRKYIVDDKIKDFTLDNKLLYLKNTLQFLKKLEETNFTLRDLKFENSGTDSDFNFVVIDYDQDTIINENRIRELIINNNLGYAIGTYPFTYLIDKTDFNFKYIYLTGLLDLFVELFNSNFSDKTIYNEIRLLLLDIVNVYRVYIKNYFNSNPIKKVLWYISDNKTKYDTLKIRYKSLLENIQKQIKDNKDKKLNELLEKFCITCLVFSNSDIESNFLTKLIELIELKGKSGLAGGYYAKYLKYKTKYLELKKEFNYF